jgi:hypothetical protein
MSGLGNTFRHLFHDQWISDHETDHFRRIEPPLLAENRAVVEFHEHHQSCLSQSFANDIFEFSERSRRFNRRTELDLSGLPTAALSAARPASNGFGETTLNLSISTRLVIIMFPRAYAVRRRRASCAVCRRYLPPAICGVCSPILEE